jgi:hypothetical protein
MNAETLMMVGGISAFMLTVYWVRSRGLRERYAIAWLLVAVLLLLCGLFPHVIMRLADATRLSYPSVVLFISLAAIYFYSFFVSVSLSRQYRRNVRLMQETAILKQRVQALRGEVDRLTGRAADAELD